MGKKLLGLSNQISVPGGPNKPVKIPKVALESDNIPVYKEGEEREALKSPEEMSHPPSPPVVNISTRLASKEQSKELLENDTIASPKTDTSEHLKAEQSTEEKPSIYKTAGPLVANELPYNQHISQSGLKGKKRN